MKNKIVQSWHSFRVAFTDFEVREYVSQLEFNKCQPK